MNMDDLRSGRENREGGGYRLDTRTLCVHNSYSNPQFGVHEPALATREARPNQKLSRFGVGMPTQRLS